MSSQVRLHVSRGRLCSCIQVHYNFDSKIPNRSCFTVLAPDMYGVVNGVSGDGTSSTVDGDGGAMTASARASSKGLSLSLLLPLLVWNLPLLLLPPRYGARRMLTLLPRPWYCTTDRMLCCCTTLRHCHHRWPFRHQ